MKTLTLTLSLILFSISVSAQFAKVQVIHNSADLALAEVDVYLDGVQVLDNFPFRWSTPFLDVPGGLPIEVSVAPGDSTGPGDAVISQTITFTANETYVIVANGIFSATGYDPAPPLSFEVYTNAREVASTATNVDILVHHGSTDAPTVDIVEIQQGGGTVVDDISYTEFQGYLELATLDYTVEIRDETGTTGVAAYLAPLQTLNLSGNALTVIASGFLDPSQNSDGPAFGLFAASNAGGGLLELPSTPLGTEDFDQSDLYIFPNPVSDKLQISNLQDVSERTLVTIIDMNGRIVLETEITNESSEISVASISEGIYNLNIHIKDKLLVSKKLIKN